MGEISAGDEHHPAAQLVHGPADALAQFVVYVRRKAGQADADHLHLVQGLVFAEKVQGDHGGMIQFRIPFPFEPGRNTGFLGIIGDQGGQGGVVVHGDFHLGRPELGETAPGMGAGGDVEIIQVQLRMGAGNHQGIGIEIRGRLHDCIVGVDGLLDLLFFTPPDFRQDDGGMGYGKRCKNGHGKHLSFLPL